MTREEAIDIIRDTYHTDTELEALEVLIPELAESEERKYVRTLKSLVSDFVRDKQPEDVAYYQKIYDWLDVKEAAE